MSDASSISGANAHHSESILSKIRADFGMETEQPIAPFLRRHKTMVKTLPNVSANDIRPDARRAAPRHNGALPYQHGRIDCELIAAGETKMQRSAYGLIVLLTLTAIPLSAEAAPAQADRQANCVASVGAIRAEWRKLSHSSSLKASQRIATGDGHWLAGSQINYAYILIGRADTACGAGKVKQAHSYVDEANNLLNPAPSGKMLAARPGN